MTKFAFLILLLASFAASAQSQRTTHATEAELAQITERGKNLAEYDVAAWYASDAVIELKPVEGSIARYIGRRNGNGWTVAFGKLNEARDKFLISYEATQGSTAKEFNAAKLGPPREDTGFFLFAARAIETSLADFEGEARPYNLAVLPASAKQLYVYVVPAQTENGVYPLGADARYLISEDGNKIIEKRQMHKSIIEFSAGANAATGYHIAVLDEVPEDSDVFHVLARKPSIPELLATKTYVYSIEPNGKIHYLMTMEAFRKSGPPK